MNAGDAEGYTALIMAAHYGQVEILDVLLEVSSPCIINKYLLCVISWAFDVLLVVCLIPASCYIFNSAHLNNMFSFSDRLSSSQYCADPIFVANDGCSAMLCAVNGGYVDCVTLLLEHKNCNVNPKPDDQRVPSPLYTAAQNGDGRIVTVGREGSI